MATQKTLQYPIKTSDTDNKLTQEITLKVSENNNMYIAHRSLIQQATTHRQGTAHCKTRSEVRGGGRKPWKQKGTGKARAGSIRSPLWKGGGIIFGPKSKKYTQKLNAKEKKLAIRNVLFNKKPNTVVIPEDILHIEKPKTKLLQTRLHNLNIPLSEKILIIVSDKTQNLFLASRNLINVELVKANQINIIALLKAKTIVVSKEGLLTIEEVYNAN